ncbi:MAG TPA: hypothetical protein ENI08_00905 [Candidatus Dependentiae bacterium]|nr:hypothetical protein [Candidatus Dependentiae bacterium]
MKASKSNTKFSVILVIVCLISTLPAYSENQLPVTKNASTWDKCKTSTSNFLKFLKENPDCWLGTIIPIVMTLRFYSGTLKGERENSRKIINSYKNANLFWQSWGCSSLNRAYFVERLSDEQLKKFFSIEKWGIAFSLGLISCVAYSTYKASQSVGFYSFWQSLQILKGRDSKVIVTLDVDREGKVAVVGEPIIIFERLGDSNTQSS